MGKNWQRIVVENFEGEKKEEKKNYIQKHI